MGLDTRPAKRNYKHLNEVEKFQHWLQHGNSKGLYLSDREREKFEKLEYLARLMSGDDDGEAVVLTQLQVRKKFNERYVTCDGNVYALNSFNKLTQMANKVFGSTQTTHREFLRRTVINGLQKGLADALDNKDWEAYVKLSKELHVYAKLDEPENSAANQTPGSNYFLLQINNNSLQINLSETYKLGKDEFETIAQELSLQDRTSDYLEAHRQYYEQIS